MNKTVCGEHNIGPDSEEWKVAYEELVSEEGEFKVPFRGQTCPMCYVRILEKYRRSRREAKIQARKAVKEGQAALRHAAVIRATVEAIKALGGPDAFELVGQKVQVSPCNRGGVPGGALEETARLENIIPNIINDLVKKAEGKK